MMNIYLVVMYIKRNGKDEKLEFIYKCKEEELQNFWKQEVKILESNGITKVESIDYFLHRGQVEL